MSITTRSFCSLFILASACVSSNALAAEDGDHHPHHLAVASGIAWQDSKSSAYIGADYVYS